jgi:hypothetical protein
MYDESKPDKTAKPASTPDELVEDLDVKLSEEEKSKAKGGLNFNLGVSMPLESKWSPLLPEE